MKVVSFNSSISIVIKKEREIEKKTLFLSLRALQEKLAIPAFQENLEKRWDKLFYL